MNSDIRAASQSTLQSSAGWTLRQVFLATLTVASVALVFIFLYRFYAVVFLIFVAVALQIALDPPIRRLANLGMHRVLSVLAVYVALFGLIVGVVWFAVPPLVDQTRDVGGELPVYYNNIRSTLLNSPIGLVRGLASVLPAEPSLPLLMAISSPEAASGAPGTDVTAVEATLPTSTAGTELTAADAAAAEQTDAVAQTARWIGVGSQVFFAFFAVFALAFFWTLEGEVILRKLILQAPATRREELRALIVESQAKIGGYFRGQVFLCAIVGVLSTIAYMLIGIPNALLLGLFMFIFESVPVLGPFLGAVPAVLVTLSVAPDKLLWVVGALLLIQTAEANLLVPRVMDKSVGVNAIVSILALSAFGALFGLIGALLAIPLAAILQIVLRRVVFATPINDDAPTVTAPPIDVSRSRLGVMRLEAQNVIEAVRKQARTEATAKQLEDGDEQLEDEIESIAIELDSLLAKVEGEAA